MPKNKGSVWVYLNILFFKIIIYSFEKYFGVCTEELLRLLENSINFVFVLKTKFSILKFYWNLIVTKNFYAVKYLEEFKQKKYLKIPVGIYYKIIVVLKIILNKRH